VNEGEGKLDLYAEQLKSIKYKLEAMLEKEK